MCHCNVTERTLNSFIVRGKLYGSLFKVVKSGVVFSSCSLYRWYGGLIFLLETLAKWVAKTSLTFLGSVTFTPLMFKTGGGLDTHFPAIFFILIHTSDVDIFQLEDKNIIHDSRLALFMVRRNRERDFFKRYNIMFTSMPSVSCKSSPHSFMGITTLQIPPWDWLAMKSATCTWNC